MRKVKKTRLVNLRKVVPKHQVDLVQILRRNQYHKQVKNLHRVENLLRNRWLLWQSKRWMVVLGIHFWLISCKIQIKPPRVKQLLHLLLSLRWRVRKVETDRIQVQHVSHEQTEKTRILLTLKSVKQTILTWKMSIVMLWSTLNTRDNWWKLQTISWTGKTICLCSLCQLQVMMKNWKMIQSLLEDSRSKLESQVRVRWQRCQSETSWRSTSQQLDVLEWY